MSEENSKRKEAVSLEDLIYDLEEEVKDAKEIVFTQKIMLEKDIILEIIEEMHEVLPVEIRQAQKVVRDRAKLLGDAQTKSENLINTASIQAKEIAEHAKLRAGQLVAEHTISQQAKERGEALILNARQGADNLLETAKAEAKDITEAATQRKNTLLSDATQVADEQKADAEKFARDICTAASNYVDRLMTETEKSFTSGLKNIESVRGQLDDRFISNKNDD